jgi:NAD(P)-dependent dehydrogenase (short-subunit alcohol dehydrogenase family)
MDLGLSGKKALVTGGTRGIGRAIAEAFADEGCHVGLCARDAQAVATTVEALRTKGITAIGDAVDVGDATALHTWVNAVGQALGGLDIVVANVSGFGMTADDAGWRRSFEIDVLGTVHVVEAAMPWLERSATPAIVAMSSIVAVESMLDVMPPAAEGAPSPYSRYWPYAAMKAALTNYVANLSSTLAPKGIRANTVTAGAIYFPGGAWHQREQEGAEIFSKMVTQCRMGRMGRPDEVAKAVVFLASPAASYITGTNVIVDGALTRRAQF